MDAALLIQKYDGRDVFWAFISKNDDMIFSGAVIDMSVPLTFYDYPASLCELVHDYQELLGMAGPVFDDIEEFFFFVERFPHISRLLIIRMDEPLNPYKTVEFIINWPRFFEKDYMVIKYFTPPSGIPVYEYVTTWPSFIDYVRKLFGKHPRLRRFDNYEAAVRHAVAMKVGING